MLEKSCIHPFEEHVFNRTLKGEQPNSIIRSCVGRYQDRCSNLLVDFKPVGPLHTIGLSKSFLTSIVLYSVLRSQFPTIPSVNDLIMMTKPLAVRIRRIKESV